MCKKKEMIDESLMNASISIELNFNEFFHTKCQNFMVHGIINQFDDKSILRQMNNSYEFWN